MKTLKTLSILFTAALFGTACGTLDDGRLCQDLDGVLTCTPAGDGLDADQQALVSSGMASGGLGYICVPTDAGRECSCQGEMDCARMIMNECLLNPEDMGFDCTGSGDDRHCTCMGKPASHTDGIGTSPIHPGGAVVAR